MVAARRHMSSSSTQHYAFHQIYPAYRAGELTAEQAKVAYQKFLTREAYRPRALNQLGALAMKQSDFVGAIGLMSQAIAHAPDHPEFHHNLAVVFGILGNGQEAEHHYVRALKLRPDYAEAYFNFADIRRFQAEDDMVKMLQKQLESIEQKSDDDRCFLHFAAGKVYQDLKDYPRAFHHFQQGNQARNAVFDRTEHEAFIQRLIEVCNHALFESRRGQGVSQASPIFIVGMPRSGTTLTESILTRHPYVQGVGELSDMYRIAQSLPSYVQEIPYPECLNAASQKVLQGLGQAYLRRTAQLAPKAQYTVDKLPNNFVHLGLIALLFPQAKIIHCQRHPLDTCLSCYCKKFRNSQAFSFDLEDLGHYYLAYERLMCHWETVLPLPIFSLPYEQLVQSQERVSRELLAFCGLPWDDACLEFNKSDRPVETASSWQVRQPLYASSIGRWKHYESQLAPLRTILNL